MLSTEAPVYTPQAEDVTSGAGYTHSGSGAPFLSAMGLDQSLILRIQARDVEAFALLYDRHAVRLYTLALHATGNTNSAEKVVINIFQTVWHSTDSYVVNTNVAYWLIGLTRQHVISLLKGSAAKSMAMEAGLEQLTANGQMPQPSHPEPMKIRLALQSLPIAQRMSIELAYYDGLSQAEIANKLDHHPRTVQRNLRQGLLSLRDKLFGK